MMKWEAESKGYTCNDCFLSMQNCHDRSICCEDETGLCDCFEEIPTGQKGEPMNDTISRQATIDALVTAIREDPYYDSNGAINGLGVCDVRVILNDLPSAQTERKKGTWNFEEHPDGYYHAECSECGQWFEESAYLKPYNYCPNCGSDMRGEQDE